MYKTMIGEFEVWMIKNGFNIIRALDGELWMYYQTAWSHQWKIYPPAEHVAKVDTFETEAEIFDYVRRFDKGKK